MSLPSNPDQNRPPYICLQSNKSEHEVLFTVRFVCLLVLLMIVPVVSQAAETNSRKDNPTLRELRLQGRKLDLSTSVTLAVERNRRLLEARMSTQEREHEARSSFSDFFPTLDLQYATIIDRYRNESFVDSIGRSHDSRRPYQLIENLFYYDKSAYPYRIDPYKYFSLTATVTQPLYVAGRTLNEYKYTRLGVDYSALQEQVDRQDLILNVYEAYYGLMRAQKLLEVAEKSITALEGLRNRAKAFYEAKVLSKLDVLSAEVQLASAKKQKIQSETNIQDQRAQLNYLMRLPLDTPIDIRHDYAYRPNNYRIPEVYDIAMANRLEIRQAGISLEQARALVKISKSTLLPSAYVQLQGSRFNDDANVFEHEAVNSWKVIGYLQWTFDLFRSKETLKERMVGEARTFTEREQLIDDILNEVGKAFRRMKRTEGDIEQNRVAVDAGEEAFRVARERYQGLMATYTEVLDAERKLAQSLGDFYGSLIDFRIDEAYLERTRGTLRN